MKTAPIGNVLPAAAASGSCPKLTTEHEIVIAWRNEEPERNLSGA